MGRDRWFRIGLAGALWVVVPAISVLMAAFVLAEHRREFHIAAALLPPLMDERGEGAEANRLREVLEPISEAGAELKLHVLPYSRHWHAFVTDPRYDLVITVPEAMDLGGSPTEPYIDYVNGIHALDPLAWQGPLDIEAHGEAFLEQNRITRIAGFVGAADLIPGLRDLIPALDYYVETGSQYSQAALLLDGKVDAVIGDQKIVAEYVDRISRERFRRTSVPKLSFVQILPSTRFKMVFRNSRDREQMLIANDQAP